MSQDEEDVLEVPEEFRDAVRDYGIRHTLPAQRGWDNSKSWTDLVGTTTAGSTLPYSLTVSNAAAPAVTLCAAEVLRDASLGEL